MLQTVPHGGDPERTISNKQQQGGMVVRREMAYAIDRYKARSGPETMCAIRIFKVLRYLRVLFLKNRSVLDMSHRYFEVIHYLEVHYSQGLPY